MTSTQPLSTPLESATSTLPVALAPTMNTAVAISQNTSETVAGKGESEQSGDFSPGAVFTTDVLLYRVPISSTNTSAAVSTYPSNLWYNYLKIPLIVSRLKGFRYIRGELEVTMVLNCPGSSVGAYICSFVPDVGITNYNTGVGGADTDNVFNSPQAPSVILNCETQMSGTMRLPFIWPENALSIANVSQNAAMWRMTIFPLAPLRSTITSATITGTISIYVRLAPGYVIENRTYQSGVTGAFARSFNELGKVPVIGSFATSAASGLAKVTSALDALGFTRESSPLMPEPSTIKLVSNMATVDGTDASHPLGLMSDNAVTIDPATVGAPSEDHMAFDYLFSRWSVITTIQPTMATSVGVIASIPVTPFLGNLVTTVQFADTWDFMPCGYVGLPFSYWSGSVQFRIYIPSSKNIQGRLQVFWEPDVTATIGANDPTIYLEGTMIDLSGSSDTLVEVHMAPPNPFRQVQQTTATVPTGSQVPSYTNGKLVFYLTQAITSPLTSFTLPIVVMARGSPSLRFHQPRSLISNRPVGQAITYHYQAKDESVEERVIHFSVGQPPATAEMYFGESVDSTRALVQKYSPYATVLINGGNENYTTNPIPPMTALALPPIAPKSYILNVTTRFATPSTGTLVSTIFKTLDPSSASWGVQSPRWTWQNHYSLLFAGVRGSTRVKAFSRTTDTDPDNHPVVQFGVASQQDMVNLQYVQDYLVANPTSAWSKFGGYGLTGLLEHYDVQGLEPDLSASEVTVPFYSPLRYVAPRVEWAPSNLTVDTPVGGAAAGLLLSMSTKGGIIPVGQQTFAIEVHVAGSADYSGIFFRRAPRVVLYGNYGTL